MTRRTHPLLSLWAWLTYAFLYLPILVLIVFSFNDSKFGATWQGFTTKWYSVLFARPDVREAVTNTLLVAVGSTAVATVLGTLVGFGLWRGGFRGRLPLTFLLVMPIVIPDVVMGVMLLMFYALVRGLLERTGWTFENGFWTVMLAHVTFQLSYVALNVRSRLAGYGRELEEAAADLGATPVQSFFQVILPLALPGVLSGALLAFTLSLDDFVVTYFTSGSGFKTLPVLIYTSVKKGVTPDINALSAMLVLFTVLLLVMGNVLSQPRRREE
ncbi:ABC transporter permease [Deinococcus radiodurans]|jgi:ABC-type spermidine/putrescine transport system, permease component II|uniref:Spermidine/putrescine ABC transporter, permease protein n=1 Tax=Deinococcus radiodurans (strain ATCC 13939 / DSM 20539 / JCM 16871 / CCUG 27074 / LMG 4051 / NBRC 15346 / NCIMB 9279 / VKM B-1422 / R1) TaxID=243230 RepID=Q9RUS8_DEIRA|nr:ABC transporter permease [Deinococcus radiodurans]AAF10874.1 spermidine/putrescine ABC transporter, permease protein [Deinococcus radiodurans R1 = ATCC 13939 = DSM 20539]ANC71537.1 spermidine/putrescine ABC transporter permease [Deinococcus radiodurans R1 = ATCC 13939 = DSM 20539]QEM70773.1 ABC transporter permease [Deinococcus radiodurans]QIP29350.1 ABC transporter permease [Deinococcus radiodurans]QIP31954.1 ABC transporter permease [Deinococcus radiodurans]